VCAGEIPVVNEVPEPVIRLRAGAPAVIRNMNAFPPMMAPPPAPLNAANWLNTPIGIRDEPLDVARPDPQRAAEHIFREADEHIAEFNRIILNADREGEL
jgi:hypothetical protein